MAKEKAASAVTPPATEVPEVKQTVTPPELVPLSEDQRSLLTWIVNRYGMDHARSSAGVLEEFVKDPQQLADYVKQLGGELQKLPALLDPFPDAATLKSVTDNAAV